MSRALLYVVAAGILNCSAFAASVSAPVDIATQPIHTADKTTLLQNYMLATCIAHVFDDPLLRDDARKATTGYIEFGNLGLDHYRHISEFIGEWLRDNAAGTSDTPLKFTQCLDFQHSVERRDTVALYASDVLPTLQYFAYDRCVELATEESRLRDTANVAAAETMQFMGIRISRETYAEFSTRAKLWLKQSGKTHLDTDSLCENFAEEKEIRALAQFHANAILKLTPQKNLSPPPSPTDNNLMLLQNYALARCVALAFDSNLVRNKADAAAKYYRESARVNDVVVYGKISKLANNWLRKSYPAKSGGEIQTMKCIDMYLSEELHDTVALYAM